MNIVCLGLSHHTAGVDVRERFAISDAQLADALGRFRLIEGVREVVILSTCNRVEFYAAGPGLLAGYPALDHFLQEHAGFAPDDLDVLYRYDFPRSAQHLFEVASGIDSMALGETEILGQVKKAYQAASDHGVTAKVLNKLFQRAFQAAKHVRTRTGISRGSISVGSVAVELAGKIFGDLSMCRVMIVGAGENSERTARSLVSRGVRHVLVANRSLEKAEAIARAVGGSAVPLERWEEEVSSLDILIASTAAPHPIITREKLEERLAGRKDRPLFVIDIAVPRDVDPGVDGIENVYLYDIDSLQAIAHQSLQERRRELGNCRGIVAGHVGEFEHWLKRAGSPGRKEGTSQGPESPPLPAAGP